MQLVLHSFNPSSLPFHAFSLTPSESNQFRQIRLADSIDVHVGELRQFTNLGRDLGGEPFGLRHIVDQLQQRMHLQTINLQTDRQTDLDVVDIVEREDGWQSDGCACLLGEKGQEFLVLLFGFLVFGRGSGLLEELVCSRTGRKHIPDLK